MLRWVSDFCIYNQAKNQSDGTISKLGHQWSPIILKTKRYTLGTKYFVGVTPHGKLLYNAIIVYYSTIFEFYGRKAVKRAKEKKACQR